jgi:enterochelin esterase-like enzyme
MTRPGTMRAMHLTRRQLLLLGAGVGASAVAGIAATEEGNKLVDRLNPPHGAVPQGPTGPVVRGVLQSRSRDREVRWAVAYPPGSKPGAALPLALVLHGRSGDSSQAFGSHALHHFLAEAVHTGTPPFAMASIDGGNHTYWHRREGGDDPQAMLLEEFLPQLKQQGLSTEYFGLTGWSMGGYGALLLASRVPERVKAVAVDAAALWRHAADTAAGAFDGADDFARNDVLGHVERLQGLPLRVGCGQSDPFIVANRALVKALPQTEHAFPRGGHNTGCWNLLRPGDVRFLGRHLAAT